MKKTIKFQKEINYEDHWDVIVIGGGPSGCTAAIAAAREGARTLLVEATGNLGGMGTSGLIPAWCPFSDKEKIIYRGLAQKIFERSKKGVPHVSKEQLDWVPINSEYLKSVYDKMVSQAGVKILFNTFVSAVEKSDEETVSGIIISNKKGLSAFSANVYIDCSGDADIIAWAGGQVFKGDNDGNLQPATHCFNLGNVDEYAYLNGPELHDSNKESPMYDIAESDKYPMINDAFACNHLLAPKTVGFNMGHLWKVDNTDPDSISRALLKGRALAEEYRKALAEYHPKAFANAYLMKTASLMGIRETRRIVGDYILTVEDYLEKRTFEDEIGRNCYYLDIHVSEKEKELQEKGEFDHEKKRCRYNKGESHGIPYRSLLPKNLKNVLVAGRSISSDRAINGSIRVMPVCLVTGEAAGMAAAITADVSKDNDVHNIDIKYLRKRLKQENVYFL